jgi:hypothetical protein
MNTEFLCTARRAKGKPESTSTVILWHYKENPDDGYNDFNAYATRDGVANRVKMSKMG